MKRLYIAILFLSSYLLDFYIIYADEITQIQSNQNSDEQNYLTKWQHWLPILAGSAVFLGISKGVIDHLNDDAKAYKNLHAPKNSDFFDHLKALDFNTRVEILKAQGRDEQSAIALAQEIGGEDEYYKKSEEIYELKHDGAKETFTLLPNQAGKHIKVVFSDTNQYNGTLNDGNKSACLVLSGIAIDRIRSIPSSEITGEFLTDNIISVPTGVGTDGGAFGDNLDDFIKPEMLFYTRMGTYRQLDFKNLGEYHPEKRNELKNQLSHIVKNHFKDNVSGLILTYGGYSVGIGLTADNKYFIFDPHGDISLYPHTKQAKTYAALYNSKTDLIDDLSRRTFFFSGIDFASEDLYFNMTYGAIGINKFYLDAL